MNATDLIARAVGRPNEGPHWCIYCGSAASVPHAVKESFTAHDTLARPAAAHICNGCQVAMQEMGIAEYPDGTRKHWSRAFRRCHSWLVTDQALTPCTYQHMGFLRGHLVSPPRQPWAACLVPLNNGRQLLYRTPANYPDAPACRVLCCGEIIEYAPRQLRDRLLLTLRIAAAAGQPALGHPVNITTASAVLAMYDDGEESLLAWDRVRTEPLTRLAIYLTPKREECSNVIRSLAS